MNKLFSMYTCLLSVAECDELIDLRSSCHAVTVLNSYNIHPSLFRLRYHVVLVLASMYYPDLVAVTSRHVLSLKGNPVLDTLKLFTGLLQQLFAI